MGYAFENPILSLVQTKTTANNSTSEADAWFASHAGPYIFQTLNESGTISYIYTASKYDGTVWQSFSKVDAAGNTVVVRLGSLRPGLTHFVQGDLSETAATTQTFAFSSTGTVWQYKVVPASGKTLFVESSDSTVTDATHVLVSTDLDPLMNDLGLTTTNFAFIQNNVGIWYSNQPVTLLQTGEGDVTYDQAVEGDVVQVDGTHESQAVAITSTAQGILNDIQSECQNLDASSFEEMGQLQQYKPLIDKALEVKAQTLLLSSTLDGVNMSQVTALATQIGDCLGDLTFTLRHSVSIDDTEVLLQIKAFVSAFANLQIQLQRFQLQISVTNTIQVPESLEIATGHLTTCKVTIDSVMESMKAFVGLSHSASNHAMSAARQQQIADAMTALEAIKSMGSTIVSNYENQSIQNVKNLADSINTDTLASLNAVKLSLDTNYLWIKTNNDQTSSQSIAFPAV